MKNLKLSAILLAILFTQCGDSNNSYKTAIDKEYQYQTWSPEVKIIEIDKCQYLLAFAGNSSGGVSIIHKQNCIYCKPPKK